MIDRQLTRRLVFPIPDLWMIGVAATTALYGLAGLQLYISAAILLLWLLPSAILCAYICPKLVFPASGSRTND